MEGITLATAQHHLNEWLKAELEVTTNQSYSIGTRSLTRADLGSIRDQIIFWDNMVNRLRGGRNRVYRAVPRDL